MADQLTEWIEMQTAAAMRLYPSMVWMLHEPDLAAIILKASAEEWDDGRVISAVQDTAWWKQRTEAARAYQEALSSDPASAEQLLRQRIREHVAFAQANGLVLNQTDATRLARQSLELGQTDAEWQANFVDYEFGARSEGGALPAYDALRKIAGDYAIPLSDQTLQTWTKQLLKGEVELETFTAYARQQAKSLYPGLSNAIDRGITVAQYAEPYAEIAAQELGINTAEIDWTDTKWQQALHTIDPKTGAARSQSLQEWTSTVRSDARLGFEDSIRGQSMASELSWGLAEMFGKRA